MAKAFRVLVRGRVQGVGFRHTVWSIAKRRGLKGYVRNLSDGSVEIIVQASRDDVEWLVERIRNLKTIDITDIEVHETTVDEDYTDFMVRR